MTGLEVKKQGLINGGTYSKCTNGGAWRDMISLVTYKIPLYLKIGLLLFGASIVLFLFAISLLTRVYAIFVEMVGVIFLLLSIDPRSKPEKPVPRQSKYIWLAFGVICGMMRMIGCNIFLPNTFIV